MISKKQGKNTHTQIDPTRSHLLKKSSRAPCALHVIDPSNSSVWPKRCGNLPNSLKIPPLLLAEICAHLLGTPNVFLTKHTLGSFPGILAMQGSKGLSGSQHSDFTTFAWCVQDGIPATSIPWGSILLGLSRWDPGPLLKVAYFCNNEFSFISPFWWMWVDGNPRKKSGRNRNPF